MTLLQQRNTLAVITVGLVIMLIWVSTNAHQHHKTAEQTIDELVVTIERSNKIVDDYNRVEKGMMDGFVMNPSKHEKALIWKPKQDSIFFYTNQLKKLIVDLQNAIATKAGADMSNGEVTFKDQGNAPVKAVMELGIGNDLFDSLQKYATVMFNIIPDDKRQSLDSLPFKFFPKISGWQQYFQKGTVKEALAMLTKLNFDVNAVANQLANFINQQFAMLDEYGMYDPYNVLVSQNTTCLLKGEKLQISVGMGSFSASIKPNVIINGNQVIANEIGMAVYTTKPNKDGKGSIPVSVSFKDPSTGETVTKSTNVSYTVFHPPTK